MSDPTSTPPFVRSASGASRPRCRACGAPPQTRAARWWRFSRLVLVAGIGFLAGATFGATVGCQTALARLDATLTRLEAEHPATAPDARPPALDTMRLYPIRPYPSRSFAP